MNRDANQPESCYCGERKKNPELYAEIPEGFCGFCDVCGKPGHTRAHPNAPTTGAWCDEHWEELLSGKSFGLLELIKYILFGISFAAGLIYWIIRLVQHL